MVEPLRFLVDSANAGERLDRFLAASIPDHTRSRLRQWIDQGLVTVGDRPIKAGLALEAGDEITVLVPEVVSSELVAEDRPLDVVFQDADIAVIVKPAGLAVHPAPGWQGTTLVHVLLARIDGLSGVGGVKRPGIVHRLDKDTTGLMVIAKNDRAHESLRSQFHDRKVDKAYAALVLGRPAGHEGLIDAPIGRHPVDRKRMSSKARLGRPARTHWKRIEDLGPASLLEVRLETGRTHQIRAHLSEAGHPIVGDEAYGFGPRVRGIVDPMARRVLESAERPMLHAARLGFRHPIAGRPLRFEAPVPADFADLLERLRAVAALRLSQGRDPSR